ncbi:MAG: DUF2510 domain-containing protein [Actinomycetota bacterium]|nr:DUF2510 domain-containing protein [Actinomycetota bacterium]
MPAGWYSDPMRRHELRWWDGQQWTTTVSDHGVIAVDAPGSPAGAVQQAPAAPRSKTPMLVGAIVGVAALVVVAVLATSGDDDTSSTNGASSTTTPIVATTTTDGPSPTTSTTAPTAPTAFDSAALVAAMPTATDVPTPWERYDEPAADPEPEYNDGYCDGPDAVARAVEFAATGRAWGPAWQLPGGGTFGVDAYAFPTAAIARQYIEATGLQARGCADAPIAFTVGEADADFLADDMGDAFVWDAIEASDATAGQFGDGIATMRATIETRYSTMVSDQACTVNVTTLVFYEQHGTVVLEYWIEGEWGHTGLGGEPDYAHHPTQADLDAAVTEISPDVQRHLGEVVGV